jgi:predicted transcriptional regulator
MEVHFTPEQEAQLSQIANHSGTDAEQLVKDAALRLLQEDDARFCEGVERGISAAERGDFVEHDQVWAGVEKILQS